MSFFSIKVIAHAKIFCVYVLYKHILAMQQKIYYIYVYTSSYR